MWVFLSGTRFLMIFLILPSIVLLTTQLTGTSKATQMRMRTKAIVIAAVAAMAIFVQGAIRDIGVEGYSKYRTASDVIRGGAVGYEHFEAMAIAIDLSDRTDTFFHEFLLPVIVRHFIPRVWWPEKPDWESWAFYNDAVTGSAGSFNVTPSITGQYYLNWGMWGIAYIGLFFGWLARCADEWLKKCTLSENFSSAVFCGFFYGFLFVSYRILSPIYIAYVLGAAVVFIMLTRRGGASRPAIVG
jgi:oligosaccharide repeat unit polymerase